MAIRNRTVIIGCGKLGTKIANDCAAKGENVVVVDIDEYVEERLSDPFPGVIVVGDATNLSMLEQRANIASARDVIITTGNDNVNIFLAHVLDKIYKTPHVYVRLDDLSYKDLIIGKYKDGTPMRIKAIYPTKLSYEAFTEVKMEDDK